MVVEIALSLLSLMKIISVFENNVKLLTFDFIV